MTFRGDDAQLSNALHECGGREKKPTRKAIWRAAAERVAEHADTIAALRAEVARLMAERDAHDGLTSEQRIKYDQLRARIAAGKASQQDACDAIKQLCTDNERLALSAGRQRARADAAFAAGVEAAAQVADGYDLSIMSQTEADLRARQIAAAIRALAAPVKGGE